MVSSLDVDDEIGDEELDWFLRWVLRHPTWDTVTPKDKVHKSTIETRPTKILTSEVLRKFHDGRDEIDDP